MKQETFGAVTIPEEFLCPLTGEVMTNPVMCRSGESFESKAILQWVETNGTNPITGEPLRVSGLVRNTALQGKIEAFTMVHKMDLSETVEETTTDDSSSTEWQEHGVESDGTFFIRPVSNIPVGAQESCNRKDGSDTKTRRRFHMFRFARKKSPPSPMLRAAGCEN